ncbi:MAG: hypothetical protein RSB82_02020 [Victivallaceae bacterium]
MLDKLHELFAKSCSLKALEFIISLLEELMSFFKDTYFKNGEAGKNEAIDAIINILETFKKAPTQTE